MADLRDYKNKDFSITVNSRMKGIELRFENTITDEQIEQIKEAGFRWSKRQQIWYAYQNEKTIAYAKSLESNYEANLENNEIKQEKAEYSEVEQTVQLQDLIAELREEIRKQNKKIKELEEIIEEKNNENEEILLEAENGEKMTIDEYNQWNEEQDLQEEIDDLQEGKNFISSLIQEESEIILTEDELEICKKIIPPNQYAYTLELTQGEEGDFYKQKLKDIAKIAMQITTDNELINEDGSHNVGFHYFVGNSDFYISEIKSDGTAFGYTILNGDVEMAEWGYQNIEEIINESQWIEMDYHVPEGMTIERMLEENYPEYYKQESVVEIEQQSDVIVPREKIFSIFNKYISNEEYATEKANKFIKGWENKDFNSLAEGLVFKKDTTAELRKLFNETEKVSLPEGNSNHLEVYTYLTKFADVETIPTEGKFNTWNDVIDYDIEVRTSLENKKNIFNFFQTHTSQTERTNYLKKEYSNGGGGVLPFNYIYTSDGIYLKALINGKIKEKSYTWAEYTKFISDKISQGTYYTEPKIEKVTNKLIPSFNLLNEKYAIEFEPADEGKINVNSEADKWIVKFYDISKVIPGEIDKGRFIQKYYASSLLQNQNSTIGLNLGYGWSLDAETFNLAKEIIKDFVSIDMSKIFSSKQNINDEYSESLSEYSKDLIKNNNSNKFSFILEKLSAAGIEVIADKEEFDRILKSNDLLQKMAIDLSEFEKLEESINNQKSSNLHLQDEKFDLESQKKIIQQKNHAKFVEVVKQLEKYIPTNEYMDTTKSVSFYSKVLINSTKLSDRASNNIFLIKVNNPGQNDIFVIRQDPKLYWVEILGKLNDFEKLSQFESVQTLFNDTVIIENFTENLKSHMQQQLVIEQQKQNKLINEVNSSMQKLKEMDIKNSDILSDFVQLDKSLRFNSNFEIESSSLNEMVSVFPGSTGKSGLGIRHIIEERYKKDNLSQDEITALSALILETVKTGELTRDSKNRCEITKNGIIAIIRKDFDDRDENWILTGFQYKGENEEKNREATEAIQTVIAQYSHSLEYSYFRNQVGAVISSLTLNISQTENKSTPQNFITQDGTTYGFAYNGKIYLNPDIVSSEAAIHEYTHLWDNYTKVTNPELWNKGKDIFKNTYLWDEVKNDEHYQDISHDEDLILSECHARFTGKVADQILDKILQENGELTKDSVINWDKEVFEYIAKEFSDKDIDIQSVSEFVSQTMKDFMEGKKLDLSKNLQQEKLLSQTSEPHTKKEIKNIREQCREILQKSDNEITEEDKLILAQYEGGGGINEENRTSAQVLNEFYTPNNLIEKVWNLVDAYHPNGKTVLEPTAGIGKFANNRPNNQFTMHELDETSARINKILHPEAKIIQGAYQKQFLDENERAKNPDFIHPKYDIVIGNPPYGEYSGKYKNIEGKHHQRYEEYFIEKGLDALKDENSILAYVVPSGFLDSKNDKVKELIASKGQFVDAYRLPAGTFTTTDVGTDILIMRSWEKVRKEFDRDFTNDGHLITKEEAFNSFQKGNSELLSNGEYFKDHPEKILGEVKQRSNQFGKLVTTVVHHEGLTIQDELNKIDDFVKEINEFSKNISNNLQQSIINSIEKEIEDLEWRNEEKEIEREIKELEFIQEMKKLSKQNFIFEKLAQAGIEVVTDKAEFDRILKSKDLLQKMAKSLSELEDMKNNYDEIQNKVLQETEEKNNLLKQENVVNNFNFEQFSKDILKYKELIPLNKEIKFYSTIGYSNFIKQDRFEQFDSVKLTNENDIDDTNLYYKNISLYISKSNENVLLLGFSNNKEYESLYDFNSNNIIPGQTQFGHNEKIKILEKFKNLCSQRDLISVLHENLKEKYQSMQVRQQDILNRLIEENAEKKDVIQDKYQNIRNLEKIEARKNILEWATKENYDIAFLNSFSKISEIFGNETKSIGVLPQEINQIFPLITDYNLYAQKDFFIDHWVNHHSELTETIFEELQNVLDNYDDIYHDSQNNTTVFVKQQGRLNDFVVVEQKNDKLVFYDSTFLRKGIPSRFKKITPARKQELNNTVEVRHISSTAEQNLLDPAAGISTLNGNINITQTENKSSQLDDGSLFVTQMKTEEVKANIYVTSPSDIVPYLNDFAKSEVENFGVVMLDSSNKVTEIRSVSVGTVNRSLVHAREVFKEAVRNSAAAVLVFHNHPSGNTKPSNEDIQTTKRLMEASNIIGIQVLDHIIVSPDNYFSFVEHDLLVDKTQNMILPDGITYGFTHDNKIYLNPDIVSSEAAIHEYTHLWDNYTKVTNPELWNKGKDIFKNTYLWEEVKNDVNYQDISHDEDLILSECHARITGKVADQILERIAARDGELTKDSVINWDKEVFEYIAKEFSDKDIDIQSVSEFVSQTMKDFMEGKQLIYEFDKNVISKAEKIEEKVLAPVMTSEDFSKLYGKDFTSEEIPIWKATNWEGIIDISKLSFQEEKLLQESSNYVEIEPEKFTHKVLFESGDIAAKITRYKNLINNLYEDDTRQKDLYQKNIKHLEQIAPPKIPMERLHFGLNSTLAEEFMVEHISFDGESVKLNLQESFILWAKGQTYAQFTDKTNYYWRGDIDFATANISQEDFPPSVSWYDIVEYIDKKPVKSERVTGTWHKEDNEIKAEKAQKKREAEEKRMARSETADKLFDRYLHEGLSEELSKKVEAEYNRRFNSYVIPDYSKLPLYIDGMSRTKNGNKFKLYDQQIKGVSFLCNKGNGLLAYDVGVGKTAAGIVATVNQIQTGRSKRPIIVVPNAVYAKWYNDICELFPNVKVNDLYNLNKESTEKYKNKDNPYKLDIEENSISLITYEGLKNITFNDQSCENELFDDFSKLLSVDFDGSSRENSKNADNIKNVIGISAQVKNTNYVFYEDCGFDNITVDEAHNFKNLWTVPRPKNKGESNEFAGIPSGKPSARALKLFAMTQYTQKHNDDRNVFLLTATPFTNSPLEVYSMLSYVGRKRLIDSGLYSLRDFCNQFAHTKLELGVDSKGEIAQKQVMKDWKELPALQKILTEFIDKVDGEELKEIIRPKKFTHVQELEMSPLQKQMMEIDTQLMNEVTEGNSAAVIVSMNAMRLALVAPALADPARYPDLEIPSMEKLVETSPKLKFVCDSVIDMYKNHPEKGQFIFMPLGQTAHGIVKDYLIAHGIPKETVEIINGSINNTTEKKDKLTQKFNNPKEKCKILIGGKNTSEGIDLNGNSFVMYNCSLGWNPSETIQAEGRIWRQGNQQGHVHCVYPVMNDSIDSLLYQKHDEKRSRINELWTYKDGDTLNVEDIRPEDLKFDLIKDPQKRAKLILENGIETEDFKFDGTKSIKNELNKVNSRIKSFDEVYEKRLKLKINLEQAEFNIKRIENNINEYKKSDLEIPEWCKAGLKDNRKNKTNYEHQLETISRKFASWGIKDEKELEEFIPNLNKQKRTLEAELQAKEKELPKILKKEMLKLNEKKVLLPSISEQRKILTEDIQKNLRPMAEVEPEIRTERFEQMLNLKWERGEITSEERELYSSAGYKNYYAWLDGEIESLGVENIIEKQTEIVQEKTVDISTDKMVENSLNNLHQKEPKNQVEKVEEKQNESNSFSENLFSESELEELATINEKLNPQLKKHQVIYYYEDSGIDEGLDFMTLSEAQKEGKKSIKEWNLDKSENGFAIFNKETKQIETIHGYFPVEKVFRNEILAINGYKVDESKQEVSLSEIQKSTKEKLAEQGASKEHFDSHVVFATRSKKENTESYGW